VTLTLPPTTGAGVAVAAFSYGVVLPAQFRPSANKTFVVDVLDNGARQTQVGMAYITAASGLIQIYRSTNASTAFTVTASAGINEGKSFSWVIQ